MTEVPDHLLQRSRERRAALGGGSAPPAAPAGGGGGDADAGGAAVAVPAAAAAPVVFEPAAPPPPPPPYVQAALDRKKVPSWMAGAGVLTLLWVFLYAGVMFTTEEAITDPVLLEGQHVYENSCASCHGASGGGGTGRPLAGEVFLTFPNIEDHIAWVVNGSPAAGTPYGDPNRPGGQHVSGETGSVMPPFGESLSPEEIEAVVRYEREVLDSAPPADGAAAEGSGEGTGAEDEAPTADGDDPSNEADAQGGSSDESTSSEDDGGSSGSGETEGAEEGSTDLDGESEDGGPEPATDVEEGEGE